MPISTYEDALDFLFGQLPMYQKIGNSAYKKDLSNIKRLCQALGNPQESLKAVHIAGTNGKGSVSHILASTLQSAGYKTGLYTSPHLLDFRERIKVDSQCIEKKDVTEFVSANQSLFESIKPSFFEMTVALSFLHFAQQQVDIAIIETGLGGRLDSTNILDPLLAIITYIGMDHMNMLGDTLPKIAAEKAGIIKPKRPVLIGRRQEEVSEVFTGKARQSEAPLYWADDIAEVRLLSSDLDSMNLDVHSSAFEGTLKLSLTGAYQLENAKTCLAALSLLNMLGLSVKPKHVELGFLKVKEQTGLFGRWQVVQNNPTVILETAHNIDGIRNLKNALQEIRHKSKHLVFGMVNDKDRQSIIKELPTDASYHLCKPQVPRGLDPEILQADLDALGLQARSHQSPQKALKSALEESAQDGLVVVCGSIFLIADIWSLYAPLSTK